MDSNEKVEYFDNHLKTVLNNYTITHVLKFLDDEMVVQLLKNLPNEIKIDIIDKNIELNIHNQEVDTGEDSWSEFYEMYDGKFDERYMLQIMVDGNYLEQIIELDYNQKNCEEEWNKIKAGEYKIDSEGNIVIIHSCPDTEIFEIDLKQYLDDLYINRKWAMEVNLTAI